MAKANPLSNSGWKIGTAPVPIPQKSRNSVSSPTAPQGFYILHFSYSKVPSSPIPSSAPPPKLSVGYRNFMSSPDLKQYPLSRSTDDTKSVSSAHSSTNSGYHSN